MPIERLQKVISRAGLASRRRAEEWIKAGRVMVNGRVITKLGFQVDPERNDVRVDGQPLAGVRPLTVMLHKPYGYVSSARDPQGRRVVTDLVKELGVRLYPVGRLDYDATGIILLTNEGELAHRLMHPRYQVPRTYRVTVDGEASFQVLKQLAGGVELEGRPVPAGVKMLKSKGGKTVLEITVWEGRYHLIKRLLAQVGHPVVKLKRLAFGPLKLGRLPRGKYRLLNAMELDLLKAAVRLGYKP